MEKIENGMKIIGYKGNLPIIQIKYSSQQPDRFTGIIEFVDWRGRVSEIEYYFDGLLHREDGPAIIQSPNFKAWYINGERHREDGPAVQYSDGDCEYHLHDQWYNSKELYDAALKKLKFNREI